MFNYDNGNLGFDINEIISRGTPRYSIKTNESDYSNVFYDLLTNDILLPAARIF